MDKFKELLGKFFTNSDLAKIEKGEITVNDAFTIVKDDISKEATKKAEKEIKREAEKQAAAMARSQVEKQIVKEFGLDLDLSAMDEKGRMTKVIEAAQSKFANQKADFDKKIEEIKASASSEDAKKLVELQSALEEAKNKANTLESEFATFKTTAEKEREEAVQAIHTEYETKAKAAKQKEYFGQHINEVLKSDVFNQKIEWNANVTGTMIEKELNRNEWNYKAVEQNGKVTHQIVDKDGNLVKQENSNQPLSVTGLLTTVAEREGAIKKSQGKDARSFKLGDVKESGIKLSGLAKKRMAQIQNS